MEKETGRVFSNQLIIGVALVVILVIITLPYIPAGIDWSTVLRPATRAFLHLENPYQVPGTFNPPWLFFILAPIAILPEGVGGAILFWLTLITWIVVTKKLGNGSILSVIAVVTSPMVVNCLLARNVDFLVMWGLLLPVEFAIFFLSIKPQVGSTVILYLAIRAYQEGGLKRVIRIFIVPFLLTILSIAAYGLWPLKAESTIDLPWNASPLKILGWPSFIIGIALFVLAITRKQSKGGANISMTSSIFFSPFVGSQSWVAILPALLKTKALYVVWAVLWAWVAYRTFR